MPKPLTIEFFDVGQGDGSLIVFPSGKKMMVDLGSTKNKDSLTSDLLARLKAYFPPGKKDLDYLVLTHGDRDHHNLVQEFVDTVGVKIKNFMYGGLAADYGGLIEWLENKGAQLLRTSGTFPCKLFTDQSRNGATVWLLSMDAPSPSRSDSAWRKNTNSIVLQITYQGYSVMLTGDATIDTEQYILGLVRGSRKFPMKSLKSDILKVAHHGSRRTSSSVEWIKAVKPEYAFVSSDRSGALGERERTGHRLPQLLTLHLIAKFSRSLSSTCANHPFVASYDPKDYEDYNKDKGPGEKLVSPLRGTSRRQWVQCTSRHAIFSTLGVMGLGQAEPDQGIRYLILMDDTGIKVNLSDYKYQPKKKDTGTLFTIQDSV